MFLWQNKHVSEYFLWFVSIIYQHNNVPIGKLTSIERFFHM